MIHWAFYRGNVLYMLNALTTTVVEAAVVAVVAEVALIHLHPIGQAPLGSGTSCARLLTDGCTQDRAFPAVMAAAALDQ